MAETTQKQSVEMKEINKVIAKIESAEDIDLPRYQALAIALLAGEVCAFREMFNADLPGAGAVIRVLIDE